MRNVTVEVQGAVGDTLQGIEVVGMSTFKMSSSRVHGEGGTTVIGLLTSGEAKVTDTRVEVSAAPQGTGKAIDVTGASFVGSDLDLIAEGAGDQYIGLRNFQSDVLLSHSRVRAGGPVTAYGILNQSGTGTTATLELFSTRVIASAGSSSLALNNAGGATANSVARVVGSLLRANTGSSTNVAVYSAAGGDVKIDTSRLESTEYTVFRLQGTVEVGASAMAGAAVSGTSITCAQVYDENYVAYDSTCP
jgi:hypothetical protein